MTTVTQTLALVPRAIAAIEALAAPVRPGLSRRERLHERLAMAVHLMADAVRGEFTSAEGSEPIPRVQLRWHWADAVVWGLMAVGLVIWWMM
jgi:hypothetical protein